MSQPATHPIAEVEATMDAWRQAMISKDGDTLARLYHDDLAYTHSNTFHENKAQQIANTVGGKAIIEAIEFLPGAVIRTYGDTAIVKGRVDFRNNVDGTVTTAHLDILHVLLKGPAGWQIVARQAIRLPQ